MSLWTQISTHRLLVWGIAMFTIAMISAALAASFALSGGPSADIHLSRPTDSVLLGPVGFFDRTKLKAAVSARSADGQLLPVTVFVGEHGALRAKVSSSGGSYDILVGPELVDAFGRPYNGPHKIHVRWDSEPLLQAMSPQHHIMVGVNANASPQSPETIAGWAKDLGVAFVRQGWGSAGANPRCKPLAELDQWEWRAFDQKMDAYQSAGLKVLLIPLQFTTPACANGGSPDNQQIMYTPELYGEYVEGLLRHVLARNSGLITAVELGNEPDVDHFWRSSNRANFMRAGDASAYFAYLKAGALAARRAEQATGQRVEILNAGYGMADLNWWRNLVNQPGLGQLVDAINVHVYPWAGPPPAEQPQGHNSMTTYAAEMDAIKNAGLGDKPVWVTELGLQVSANCPFATDEATEAVTLRNMMVFLNDQAVPRVQAVAWFTLQDDSRVREGLKPGDCYSDQGLGLIDDSGRKRPAFYALEKWIAHAGD